MTTQADTQQGFNRPDSAEDVSTETPVVTTESESQGEIVDWQARYNSEAAARVKAESDLKSQSKGRQNADERQESVLREIRQSREETEMLRKQTEAMMRAMASGDSDGLPQEMARIEQETQQRSYSQRQVDAVNSIYNQIIDIVVPIANGDKEAAKELIETSPDFRTVLDGWMEHGQRNIDVVSLAGVVAQTSKVVGGLYARQASDQVRAVEEAAARRLEEADVMNLDAGSTSVSANMSDRARNDVLADPDYEWTDDDKRWYLARSKNRQR